MNPYSNHRRLLIWLVLSKRQSTPFALLLSTCAEQTSVQTMLCRLSPQRCSAQNFRTSAKSSSPSRASRRKTKGRTLSDGIVFSIIMLMLIYEHDKSHKKYFCLVVVVIVLCAWCVYSWQFTVLFIHFMFANGYACLLFKYYALGRQLLLKSHMNVWNNLCQKRISTCTYVYEFLVK